MQPNKSLLRPPSAVSRLPTTNLAAATTTTGGLSNTRLPKFRIGSPLTSSQIKSNIRPITITSNHVTNQASSTSTRPIPGPRFSPSSSTTARTTNHNNRAHTAPTTKIPPTSKLKPVSSSKTIPSASPTKPKNVIKIVKSERTTTAVTTSESLDIGDVANDIKQIRCLLEGLKQVLEQDLNPKPEQQYRLNEDKRGEYYTTN